MNFARRHLKFFSCLVVTVEYLEDPGCPVGKMNRDREKRNRKRETERREKESERTCGGKATRRRKREENADG